MQADLQLARRVEAADAPVELNHERRGRRQIGDRRVDARANALADASADAPPDALTDTGTGADARTNTNACSPAAVATAIA